MQRPFGASLGRLQRRDHGVQPRPVLLEARVAREQLEVLHLATSPPLLDRADQRQGAADVLAVDDAQDRLRLCLSPADGEVAIDAGVRLRRPAVELDQALDRAFEVLRVEAVERLRRDRCRVQHLLGEANE